MSNVAYGFAFAKANVWELDALIVDDVHTLRGHLAASSFEKGGVKLANAAHRDPEKSSGIYL